jgi:uncharacterized protein YdaU (DUF1376 family)
MRQPPAFQFYASDWLAREAVRLMSLEEFGLLCAMLAHAWVNDSLPDNPDALARLIGHSPQSVAKSLTGFVLRFFQPDGHGRLVCPELVEQKANLQERHEERSRSGKKGAQAKWRPQHRDLAELTAEPLRAPMAASEMSGAELSKDELSKDELGKGDLSGPEPKFGKTLRTRLGDSARSGTDEQYVDRSFNRDDDADLPF